MVRYYRNRNRSSSAGYEQARKHIEAARLLSQELGGTDKDVKAYFFSLPPDKLSSLMTEYNKQYGAKARDYAIKSMSKWRSGKVQMSGMVAERLFNLLPPMMPIEKKYELTTSLWNHVGNSTQKTYYIPTEANIETVIETVKTYLEQVATEHSIPDGMEKRFNWLSQGDVAVKQKLLNHIRDTEKTVLTNALKNQLQVLSDHLQSNSNEDVKSHASQTLVVGKHKVEIIFNNQVTEITDIKPQPVYVKPESNYDWIWWIVGAVILYAVFGE